MRGVLAARIDEVFIEDPRAPHIRHVLVVSLALSHIGSASPMSPSTALSEVVRGLSLVLLLLNRVQLSETIRAAHEHVHLSGDPALALELARPCKVVIHVSAYTGLSHQV